MKLRYNNDNKTDDYNSVSNFEFNVCGRTFLNEENGLKKVAKAEGAGDTGRNNNYNNIDDIMENIQGNGDDDKVIESELDGESHGERMEARECIQDVGAEEELEGLDVGSSTENDEKKKKNPPVGAFFLPVT